MCPSQVDRLVRDGGVEVARRQANPQTFARNGNLPNWNCSASPHQSRRRLFSNLRCLAEFKRPHSLRKQVRCILGANSFKVAAPFDTLNASNSAARLRNPLISC